MRRTGRLRGSILIAVLVVGTALTMLALASSTLALVQLRSATYLAAAQQARAAAEMGVLLVEAQLRSAWLREGRLPADVPEPPAGVGFDLRVTFYQLHGEDEAEFEIEARHDGARAVAGGRATLP